MIALFDGNTHSILSINKVHNVLKHHSFTEKEEEAKKTSHPSSPILTIQDRDVILCWGRTFHKMYSCAVIGVKSRKAVQSKKKKGYKDLCWVMQFWKSWTLHSWKHIGSCIAQKKDIHNIPLLCVTSGERTASWSATHSGITERQGVTRRHNIPS